jgi:hypothetical protein
MAESITTLILAGETLYGCSTLRDQSQPVQPHWVMGRTRSEILVGYLPGDARNVTVLRTAIRQHIRERLQAW